MIEPICALFSIMIFYSHPRFTVYLWINFFFDCVVGGRGFGGGGDKRYRSYHSCFFELGVTGAPALWVWKSHIFLWKRAVFVFLLKLTATHPDKANPRKTASLESLNTSVGTMEVPL